MAHAYTQLIYHIVFATRGRACSVGLDWLPRLCDVFGGILRGIRGTMLAAGGTDNHVHIATGLPASVAVADAACAVKANSSKWVHDTFPAWEGFAWQEGYSAFTVSPSNLESVKTYIQRQGEHHKTMSFDDELCELLRRHGIEFDPSRALDAPRASAPLTGLEEE